MPIHRGALLRALAVAGALSTCSAFAVNAGVAEACHADAASVCPGMEPGDGNFARCMKEHHDKLSEGIEGFSSALVKLENLLANRLAQLEQRTPAAV